METTGLAVGTVALAGLFNNAVDCFEYIQLGRGFSKSFETNLLMLDCARLRLSRWGQSIGLTDELTDLSSSQRLSLKEQDIHRAEALLGHLLELFADAERISDKTDQQMHDVSTDSDPITASLHYKMRDLSIKRQNRTTLRKKARWALYEEKRFRKLITDITNLTTELVGLFPDAQPLQQRLCAVEVAELGAAGEGLPILKRIAADQDKDLEAAISKATKPQVNMLTSP